MFSLNIENDCLYFKDIKPEDLPRILKWYNNADEYGFATGMGRNISLEMLSRKYAEAAICSDEFFVGIYIKKNDIMIGILKGRLGYKNRDAIWISSIVIDSSFQNMGYGSMSIDLLLSYMKTHNKIKNAYLVVVEDNLAGKRFWQKQKFQELRIVEKYLELQDKRKNVILMHKCI